MQVKAIVSAGFLGCAGNSTRTQGGLSVSGTLSWTCEHVFGHEHTSTVTSLVRSIDGRLLSMVLSGSNDGTIAVWVVEAAGAVGGGGQELTEAAATEAAASSSSSSYATKVTKRHSKVTAVRCCLGHRTRTLRVWSSTNDGVGDAAGGGGGAGGEDPSGACSGDLGSFSSSSSSSPSSSSPLQWRCVRTLDNPGWANVVYHDRVLSGVC